MPEPSISIAIKIARAVALNEAATLGHANSRNLHLLIGICSIDKVLAHGEYGGKRLTTVERAVLENEWREADEHVFSKATVDPIALRRALRDSLRPAGAQAPSPSKPVDSADVIKAFANAHLYAVHEPSEQVRLVHLLYAVIGLDNTVVIEMLTRASDFDAASKLLEKIGIPAEWLKPAGAARNPVNEPAPPARAEAIPRDRFQLPEALAQLGIDMTQLAEEGKLEACIGRREELLQLVRTLSRETKNNSVLVGDAGVGKTAIVEGLAVRIAEGKSLPGHRVVQIQVNDLIAGTETRGDFEKRMRDIIEAASDSRIILFFDEIHTLLGAGRVSGSPLDAGNILKPALARGEIRCIGATTREEYRKYFESDSALSRRFQPLYVNEPTAEETLTMLLESYLPRLCARYAVKIDAAAAEAAVRLSVRYLPERRLPDKAIDLLDEACARVAVPTLSVRPESAPPRMTVAVKHVAEAAAQWARIPIAQIDGDERERLMRMADELKARIFGQDEACELVAAAAQRSRAGIRDAGRPVGVFLFIGPTGVGKTELAKATAAFLFGSAASLVRIDMSEFSEKHTVSRLIGAPPGYIGYGEEGILTGALARTPYCVILLDEIDKAHPDVLKVFLPMFDDARLTDSKGRTTDASHAMFIMTANQAETGVNVGFQAGRPLHQSSERARLLCPSFTPEFMNRIDEVIIFRSLDESNARAIARHLVAALAVRLLAHGIRLDVADSALDYLSTRGFDPQYGARPMRRLIEQQIENEIAGRILRDQVRDGHVLCVTANGGELHFDVVGGVTL